MMNTVRNSPGEPASDPVDALILDLLEWIGPAPRPYAEVIDAWRTSCPRLPVWEDANDRGFVTCNRDPERGRMVAVTAAGWAHLRAQRAGDVPSGSPMSPAR